MRVGSMVCRAGWLAAALGALVFWPGGSRATGAAQPAAPVAPSIEASLAQGLAHLADGEYEAADATWARLRELAPAHPAAYVHAVDTLYWRDIHVDDGSGFDPAIEQGATLAVERARAWAEGRSRDPLAQLYLGQALIQLGRFHGTRLRIVKAGGLGEEGRKSLGRALALDPALADARYPLGLYQYYAGQIPNLLSWLKFLWFMPEGDVQGGLANLERAREGGDRYRFDAAFYLTNIRAYHESVRDVDWAVRETRVLHDRHPRNALVHFELLELLAMQGEYEAARLEAQKLEAHPGRATSAEARGRANMATVWRARAELALGQPERALGTLHGFGEDGPSEPDWGARWVQVTRGQALDALGRRDEAIARYERVVALDLDDDSRARAEAEAGLAAPPAVASGPPEVQ